MSRSLPGVLLLSLGALPMAAESVYVLDSRALLVKFDTSLPAFITDVRLIRGMQPGESMLGIDFRPANKMLYGLGSSNRIYIIDPETGIAKAVSDTPFTPALDGAEFGFDFNPTVDRIRVVSDRGQNLRLHPDTGQVVATDGALAYEDGEPAGVVAAAYTNSVAGAASTTLYNIDARRNLLVTQNPPNEGRLNVVGPLRGLDLSRLAGFDISPNTNRGFAAIRLAGGNACQFFEIHLSTGDYLPLGVLGIFEQVSGVAVMPER